LEACSNIILVGPGFISKFLGVYRCCLACWETKLSYQILIEYSIGGSLLILVFENKENFSAIFPMRKEYFFGDFLVSLPGCFSSQNLHLYHPNFLQLNYFTLLLLHCLAEHFTGGTPSFHWVVFS
jgi:hypothetical protein